MDELKQNQVIAKELSKRTEFDYIVHDSCDPVYITRALRDKVDAAGGTGDFQMQRRALFTYSLDSCRLFEETLDNWEYVDYLKQRMLLLPKDNEDRGGGMVELDKQTPAQRCESFLRMLNKWEES